MNGCQINDGHGYTDEYIIRVFVAILSFIYHALQSLVSLSIMVKYHLSSILVK